MTLKERMVTALTGGIPDSVPTFELEFQIEDQMFGKTFDYSKIEEKNFANLSEKEKDILINEYVEHTIDIFVNKLEYSSIPLRLNLDDKYRKMLIKLLKEKTNDSVMIHAHGDGTYNIPDGNEMYKFSYWIADDYEGALKLAEKMSNEAVEKNKRLAEEGVDLFVLCADYCYNSGPFLSPPMFGELIAPYLAKIIEGIKASGAYAIKHTDGNIMPILDQLIECRPHALHSIDPMAGVDIAEVKRIANSRIALCGNVNCALMQTGTDEEVLASCEYAMKSGKPGGGYVFTTSNVPFRGLPADRYRMMLDYWKQNRSYDL